MALYHDEGVVLRTAKLGEADRIITLLTRDHGKVRAVAKGVRRAKSRFGGRLEPFMRVDVLIAEGRTLDTISQAESISAYAGPICADYDSYAAANVIAETADKLASAENERVTAQYRLLAGALNALATHAHGPELISASYVMRALSLAGWTPRLASCMVCDSREITHFSVPDGGALCATHHTPRSEPIPLPVRAELEALMNGDWRELEGVREPMPQTRAIIEEWAEYYLERPLRSLRVIGA